MNTSRQKPVPLTKDCAYDSFANGKPILGKKKNHLPAMGWNSWNAFGSGNTEELTKKMADCIKELELDKLGYEYIVLDDGCYKPERVNGLLSNEEIKFPSGFKALADYIHARGLKFGMYNDIGTNLCAGAAVGTCGHEKTDAKSSARPPVMSANRFDILADKAEWRLSAENGGLPHYETVRRGYRRPAPRPNPVERFSGPGRPALPGIERVRFGNPPEINYI
jgi:hypothetical protein